MSWQLSHRASQLGKIVDPIGLGDAHDRYAIFPGRENMLQGGSNLGAGEIGLAVMSQYRSSSGFWDVYHRDKTVLFREILTSLDTAAGVGPQLGG